MESSQITKSTLGDFVAWLVSIRIVAWFFASMVFGGYVISLVAALVQSTGYYGPAWYVVLTYLANMVWPIEIYVGDVRTMEMEDQIRYAEIWLASLRATASRVVHEGRVPVWSWSWLVVGRPLPYEAGVEPFTAESMPADIGIWSDGAVFLEQTFTYEQTVASTLTSSFGTYSSYASTLTTLVPLVVNEPLMPLLLLVVVGCLLVGASYVARGRVRV